MSVSESALRGRTIRAGIALLVATLLVTAAPLSVSAARATTFDIELGFWCVQGRAKDAAWVVVTWKDGDGTLKAKSGTRASKKGYWGFCGDADERVERGDTIKAKVGGSSRTVTVPILRLSVDRSTDTVTGKAPAGTTLTMDAQQPLNYNFWKWNARRHVTSVTADGGGSFAVDYSDPSVLGYVQDLRGRDYIEASFKTGAGDRFTRGQHVPFISVVRGKARFEGWYLPFKKLTVELWRASTMIDDWSGRADDWDWGFFRGRFADKDGDTYRVRTNDRIVAADLGGDADWVVPAVEVSGDGKNDRVTGTCAQHARYGVLIRSGSGALRKRLSGVVNQTGQFTHDLRRKLDIKSGNVIWLYCGLASGDVVAHRSVVK